MRLMKRNKKATAILTVALLTVAGGAYAYWTNTGSGSGTAATGSNAPVVVVQTSTVTGLAPGLGAQALSGKFNNPNGGPVFVAAVSATVTGTDQTGCDATDYIIAGTATVNAQIPAGTAQGTWTGLTIQFNNKPATNQDACKDAIVTIGYTSN